ncbi:MAG: DNA polymerase III subunit gamma/tau [Proteobacteria bacterium]|nr:DNA polymerase III subunit gamma/tau [Pseudomonadota bacterium]
MTESQGQIALDAGAPGAEPASYRVLARKYRPRTFAEMIGQEAMVRTLTNAIASGRIAHAFILTGVRGVGKTTTARIIARILNCVGPEGKGGPTVDPCGVCEHCRAIAEDRHVDVIEMDAASRTGVDDIREIIEGVRYRPVSARYKVYIVDEVHMLSKPAFNALLKTLEEPPEHVKFVFATTEIRKVPVTVLSRCQRFDLRRVEVAPLAQHLAAIAGREGAEAEARALALIARAADGSVRDGLSLLDQAIAHGGGTVAEAAVKEMLGLADREQVFDLLDAVMAGDLARALDLLAAQYAAGADPGVVVQDLMELTHWLTRLKVVPEAADAPGVPEAERVRGRAMAEGLSVATLARGWQMLMKGLAEVQSAPSPLQAAEMLLVRLAYAAELPTPAELVAEMARGGAGQAGARPARERSAPSAPPGRPPAAEAAGRERTPAAAPPSGPTAMLAEARSPEPAPEPAAAPRAEPKSFAEMVELVREKREALLHAHLVNNVHPVSFQPGRVEFRPGEHAPRDLASRLSEALARWTGQRWVVTISRETGEPTLAERANAAEAALRRDASQHPLVRRMLEAFPGATIEAVRRIVPPAGPAADAEEPFAGGARGEDALNGGGDEG